MKSVDRLEIPAVRQSGKTDDAHVDTDVITSMHGLFLLVFGLDGDVTFATFKENGNVLDCTDDFTAVAIAHPTDFRQIDTVVILV